MPIPPATDQQHHQAVEGLPHTPGPWTAEPEYEGGEPTYVHATGCPIAECDGGTKEDAAANARLIAAAPKMLNALRNVQKIITEAAWTGFNCHDGDWPERLFASQQVTSDALKDATGRHGGGDL